LVIASALPLFLQEWSWFLTYFSTQSNHSEGSAFFKKAFSESLLLCNFIDLERFLIFMGVQLIKESPKNSDNLQAKLLSLIRTIMF